MGDDGSESTNGYMSAGETPDFKVFDSSEQELINMRNEQIIGLN